ncbi:imm11 family protein [Archangium lansingense]|uniref:imm11 family protein n=1 Tax=Archangium lansingense TaxID=2995310 RepID=UPI003B7FC373
MQRYVLVEDLDIDDNAVLTDHPPEARDRMYLFQEGEPLESWFPKNAEYRMGSRYPNARGLYDLQSSTLSILVVSKALREALVEVGCRNIEFLPIVILNHRGKVASREYSIANVLGLTDCVNRSKSAYTVDALIPTMFHGIKKLVLEEDKVPVDLHIFRLKEMPTTHIITEALKSAIEARGLRGMLFIPIDEYDSALHT